jgi:hypothetical protein
MCGLCRNRNHLNRKLQCQAAVRGNYASVGISRLIFANKTKARRALATKLLRRLKSCRWWHSERAFTATKQLLVCASFFFQYVMDVTETACVCALFLRTRKVQRKKQHWVHSIVSKRILNGQFYKLYEDLKNCGGKIFSYFRMSIESFDILLVLGY